MCAAFYLRGAVCRQRVHRVTDTSRVEADDGGLRQSLRRIWSDHLWEQDVDHVNGDSACAGNADSLQLQGATPPPDNLLHFFLGDAVTGTLTLSADIDGWIRVGVDGLQAPHTGAVRSTVGACLLDLETGVVKSEEGTALLYGCTT